MPIPGEMLKQGWGVLRLKPWHLAGIFTSSADAEALAQNLGPPYEVRYGDYDASVSNFSFTTTSDSIPREVG